MLGLQIHRGNISSLFASLSALAALSTMALGIWLGPPAIYVSSTIGLTCALLSLGRAWMGQDLSKPIFFPSLMAALHTILLVTGGVLQLLFIAPLNKEVQKIPSFQEEYVDPAKFFSLRGPQGWVYENLGSRMEAGVRIRPSAQKQ